MRLLLWCSLLMLAAAPKVYGQGLEDFSRFSRLIGKEVSVVDRSGLVREGIVETVTADDVVIRLGASTRRMPRAEIAGAERLKDGRRDGAIKGAIFGAITGALAMRAYHRHPEWLSPSANRTGMFLLHVSSWSGLGWLLDAANTNREQFYRSPAAAPMGALQLSFRF
jgi:hypothetical protein